MEANLTSFEAKPFVLAAQICLSALILLHVRFLGAAFSNDVIFLWLPILAMGFLAASSALLSDGSFPLASIMILSVTLHMITAVAQPDGILWGYDPAFHFQLLQYTSYSGHWQIPFLQGWDAAYAYSYYPNSDILWLTVQSITSLAVVSTIKFYPVIVNNLVLVFLYLLLSRTIGLGSRVGSLGALVFALNPIFHAKYSGIAQETYAVILFSLVIAYSMSTSHQTKRGSSKRSVFAVVALAVFGIALGHHFTSYMLVLAVIVPTIVVYGIMRRAPVRQGVMLLTTIIPLVWLIFIGTYFLEGHIATLLQALQSLEFVAWQVGRSSQYFSGYYSSQTIANLTIVRNVLLAGFTFLGFLYCLAKLGFRLRSPVLRPFVVDLPVAYTVAAFLVFSGVTFVSFFGTRVWGASQPMDLMVRPLNFAFFFIAPLAALGILKSVHLVEEFLLRLFRRLSLRSRQVLRASVALLLIAVFLPSCLVQAQPRYNYDSQYTPVLYDEWSVDPQEQFAHGFWVGSHVTSADTAVFGGSESCMRYVMAYGNKKEWIANLNATAVGSLDEYYGRTLHYVIDRNNLRMDGETGERLKGSDLQLLNMGYSKVYDDGTLAEYLIALPASG